jgi:hypothetical protein
MDSDGQAEDGFLPRDFLFNPDAGLFPRLPQMTGDIPQPPVS